MKVSAVRFVFYRLQNATGLNSQTGSGSPLGPIQMTCRSTGGGTRCGVTSSFLRLHPAAVKRGFLYLCGDRWASSIHACVCLCSAINVECGVLLEKLQMLSSDCLHVHSVTEEWRSAACFHISETFRL